MHPFLTTLLLTLPATTSADSTALALVDHALGRMGGRPALEAIERVRYTMITQWQRASFEALPGTDRPSYEQNTDERDYTIGGWRNVRSFPISGGEWRTITDLVRDSVAARDVGRGLEPLNITYVDERDELFTYTPDRLVLRLRDATDLNVLSDTSIAGILHARVHATLQDQPLTLHLRRSDGLPAMVSFVAAHPNDFGLVPWGEMEVEVWYSSWATSREGVSLPRQWDVRRFGQPYKRLTILDMVPNPDLPAETFAVSDSLRKAYHASATRPMHDMALDSAVVREDRFVEFRSFGGPMGAVRVGGGWLLLGAGQASLSAERALDWMRQNVRGEVAGAIIGMARTGNGGVVELRRRGTSLWVGRGAVPFVRTMLRNHGQPEDGFTAVEDTAALTIDGEEVRIETVDLPDVRGATLVWVPGLRWLHAPDVVTGLDLDIVLEHARLRGWRVERMGTSRGLLQPVPEG